MYNVYYTIYNIHCIVCNVQCILYNIQCILYNIQCILDIIQYTLYNTIVCYTFNVCMYYVQGAYQKFCTLTINFFIMHFRCHLSHQL